MDDEVFERAPDRFRQEIVVAVLRDLSVNVAKARQRVTIGYADFDVARALDIKVNSAVFKVQRAFFDQADKLIYEAKLIYPGDMLDLDIEFSTGGAPAGVSA